MKCIDAVEQAYKNGYNAGKADASEKMTPKKPLVEKFSSFGCVVRCICGHRFYYKIDGEYVAGKKSNYCPDCGQLIDWSDDDGR